MEKIPSALEFLIIEESKFNEHVSGEVFPILEKLLKEFAKLHVEAALKAKVKAMIQERFKDSSYDMYKLDAFTKNAYPLTNIK